MPTVLYQLELDQSNVNCGMSYVFHLENGHFFIIYGGYFTDGEDSLLYDFLCEKSSEKLKCEIIQISHHPIDNYESMCKLYGTTGATIALWPVSDYGIIERRKQSVNNFILNEINIVEHHVGGYGTVKLPLPYSPGMAEKSPKAYSFEKSGDECRIWDKESNNPSAFRYLTPNRVAPF